MTAISITAGNVVASQTGWGVETSYLAGGTLTRGIPIYLSASNTWIAADSDASVLAAGSGGIAISLSDVASGQACLAMLFGNIAYGAVLTKGTIYCVGTTAGQIVPYGDLSGSANVTILGIATTTSNLWLRPWATGYNFS